MSVNLKMLIGGKVHFLVKPAEMVWLQKILRSKKRSMIAQPPLLPTLLNIFKQYTQALPYSHDEVQLHDYLLNITFMLFLDVFFSLQPPKPGSHKSDNLSAVNLPRSSVYF